MIKRFEYLYTLYNNAFKYTPVVYSFYREYVGQDKDILLSYLILPLVLNEKSKNSLIHSKTNSSLYTFCRKKENLIGLPEMVKQYKTITNECIQYGLECNLFSISQSLCISINDLPDDYSFVENSESKAAKKLAKIIKTTDIPTIYRYLGIAEL